ncbi:MAG TPA: L-erythro-3,5-diaminohexanoate dehydrogenase [Myxococcaceae bacterium]|nr:L-erythro-3,5-diaminohexanoate dehydrogenase [Myxococcaceae bacterium]
MEIDRYGIGRVVGEPGVLPQRAQRLDASLPLRPGELLIDVDSLNIDAASFKQLVEASGGDEARLASMIQDIVRARGKMQNPVTGSGGMLMGRVREVDARHPAAGTLRSGERIATLVSLSLTPLVIEEIRAIHRAIDRVELRGYALLFPSGLYARLPPDIEDTVALAALDVCGAPALVARHVLPGMTVAVLGAGKSGALALAKARQMLGGSGRLLALDVSEEAVEGLRQNGLCDDGLTVDATDAVQTMHAISGATGGALCDLVISCASVPQTEMAAILSARDGGTVIFFSMATSFSAAALGAEGVGKDVTLIIGNGYVPGHADLTLELLRSDRRLRELFERRYGVQK